MCTSQLASSLSLSRASWAAGLDAELIDRAMSVSSRSRLTLFSLRMRVLRFRTDSVMDSGSSLIMDGIPARCLMAWMTTLEAACSSGELLPVTIVPSLSSIAAPQ